MTERWGILPAAGRGKRIQPLAFSKELLPVGTRVEGETERPMAVSEHLVERLLAVGVSKLCFVISPAKSDIVGYYGGAVGGAHICYVVQSEPSGLCDALFRALPFVADEDLAYVGLPDTIWFPEDGLASLETEDDDLSFLLFPVDHPELFDAVVVDDRGLVLDVQVKSPSPRSRWVWGAFRVRGRVLRELHALWLAPDRRDEYFGTLVNAYLARGGKARGVTSGRAYVDVGTVNGYREATKLLEAVKLLEDVQLIDGARRIGARSSRKPGGPERRIGGK
jgi:dTDP-glucose pyrophosphorylase